MDDTQRTKGPKPNHQPLPAAAAPMQAEEGHERRGGRFAPQCQHVVLVAPETWGGWPAMRRGNRGASVEVIALWCRPQSPSHASGTKTCILIVGREPTTPSRKGWSVRSPASTCWGCPPV